MTHFVCHLVVVSGVTEVPAVDLAAAHDPDYQFDCSLLGYDCTGLAMVRVRFLIVVVCLAPLEQSKELATAGQNFYTVPRYHA